MPLYQFYTTKTCSLALYFRFLGLLLNTNIYTPFLVENFAFFGVILGELLTVWHLYTAKTLFLALIFAFLALFFTSTIICTFFACEFRFFG